MARAEGLTATVASWPDQASAQLDTALAAAADPATRDHWTRYLKGQAIFRGVPMREVRRAVRAVWRDHALAVRPVDEVLTLSRRWFAAPATEDKLAGVLLIAEHLAAALEQRHVECLSGPLAERHLADWNIVDWYATKALHAFATSQSGELERRVRAIAAWSRADGLWQRRAAVVALVKLAPEPPFAAFTDLALDACAANLVSDDRFAHTGPGWLLRELSRAEPAAVAAFVHAHPELSREATRMATANLRAGPYRRR